MATFTKGKTASAIWPQAVAKTVDCETTVFLRQLVAEIPWGHHRLMLAKLTEPAARLWYLTATAQTGWSRNVLLNQIKAAAFERTVEERKTNCFELKLTQRLITDTEVLP